jgi:hypothetical protein
MTPLRFANPSQPSGWIEDFHLQAVVHARHTKRPTATYRGELQEAERSDQVREMCELGMLDTPVKLIVVPSLSVISALPPTFD